MASSRFSIAVHTLALLAHDERDKPLKSEYIACLVKTNAVVIRRLLSDLASANLVVSQAGATGGTRLARAPAEISLTEVYRAVEGGEIFSLHRQKPDSHCDIGRSIQAVLSKIQDRLDTAIEENLGKISLAEVLSMIEIENKNCLNKYQGENLR
ncbi:MAG: Rrf2 family transcriptional regulator [Pyrinomonadaceae bacterium]